MTKSTGGIDHIINDDNIRTVDLTNEVHSLDGVSLDTLLDDHGETSINATLSKTITEALSTVDTTSIRGDDLGSLRVQAQRSEVLEANDLALEVVTRGARTEEALDLATVKINSNDAVDTHGLHEAGNVSSGDGDTRSHLAILAGITVVGDDCSNLVSRSTTHSRDHEQKLDEVVVDARRAGRLDDEDLLATDVVQDLDTDLTISVALDSDTTKVNIQQTSDLLSKLRVSTAREKLNVLKRRILRLMGRIREGNRHRKCRESRASGGSTEDLGT
jgi:hypothetical protein